MVPYWELSQRLQGLYSFFPPFPTTGKNRFPKHLFFPHWEKGQNRLGAFCRTCSLGLRVSIRASITNRMVTSATTIEYRIRYNQVSSGHSAITALQLIKFQVYSCRQPRRRGPLQTQNPQSSPFENVQRPSPRIECRRWPFSNGSKPISGNVWL